MPKRYQIKQAKKEAEARAREEAAQVGKEDESRARKEAEARAFDRDVFLKRMDLAADSEDEFELLDPATAKELLGGAYNPNLFYQRNKKNNKVEVAGKLNKEIIKENKDFYKEEFDKNQGKADVELVSGAEKSFANAVKFQSTLDTLNILANTPDEELKTGAFGELRTSITKIGKEFYGRRVPADTTDLRNPTVAKTKKFNVNCQNCFTIAILEWTLKNFATKETIMEKYKLGLS